MPAYQDGVQTVGEGVVITLMCHKYDVKHTSKQYNLHSLQSGSKKDTNKTPTCAVPVHAMLSHACMRRFCGLRRRDHVRTESSSMMDAPACSGPAARRKVGSASDLRVESCPRHTQRVAASPAIPTAVISILHQRMSPEAPKNGTHDRTGG